MEPILAIMSIYEAMKAKLNSIERRSMNDNQKPSEAVRQMQEVFTSFEPGKGDAAWVLRSMRDIALHYLRAISMRYPSMRSEEKAHLVHLVAYEAARRHLWSTEGDEKARKKYRLAVRLCEEMEAAEDSICWPARIFTSTTLRSEVVDQGYEASAAYHWLRCKSSLEAKFEMQTFLMENHEKVKKVKEHILESHGSEPAAKRQKKMADCGA